MTLTKERIIQRLCKSNGLSRKEAAQVFYTFLETIEGTLEKGEDVLISRFGKFSVMKKHPRRGRNPATGEDLVLGARTVVTFKCSGVLRGKVN